MGTAIRHVWGTAVLCAALLVLLGHPIEARAEDQSHVIGGVSCPTSSFCAAFQIGGTNLLTADPAVDSSWHAEDLTEANVGLTALSCPSAGFCAAADYVGDVITSTDPSSPAPTWGTAHVDGRGLRSASGSRGVPIEGISCASEALCVAVDSGGYVLSTSEPTGGRGAWHRAAVDTPHQFDAISCAPDSEFCAAVDMEGRLFVSSNVTGGASTWRSTQLNAGAHGQDWTNIFIGISCPTSGFCMAVTSDDQVFTSTNPADPGSWQETSNIGDRGFDDALSRPITRPRAVAHASGAASSVSTDGENILSCPSASFCAMPGFVEQEMWLTADPTGGSNGWSGVDLPQFVKGSENTVTAVSCASPQFCVAGTWLGEGLVSENPRGGSSAWPTRLAPAVLPPAPSELRLSNVSLKGTIKPEYPGAPLFGYRTKTKASLSFTVSAQYPMHPVAGVNVYGLLNKYMKVPGGYHEAFNGFLISESRRQLEKSVKVFSQGRRIPCSVKAQRDEGLSIYIKRPAAQVTVKISTPGLQLSYQALAALEHKHQAIVQMFVNPWDEVGGGEESGFFPRFKAKLQVVKAKPPLRDTVAIRSRNGRPQSARS